MLITSNPNSPEISSEPIVSMESFVTDEKKSLINDLRKLLYDERFYDISLKCSDNVILSASKNILAIRTEVFNDHIFDKSKKNNSNNNRQQIEFESINSVAMKFILEYLYTSKNVNEKLSDKNVIEIYYSAIYFKLKDLQGDIIIFTMQILQDGDEELGKTLLSECIEKFSLKEENAMSKLLVHWVAKMQLSPGLADNDSLTPMGLQYFLKKTYDTDKSFATYEIDLFEYTMLKIKKMILEDEKSDSTKDPYYMNYDSSTIERINERLKPLLESINLCIMNSDDVRKLETLKVFPQDMIISAYRYRLEIKHENIQPMRGRLIFKWKSDNETDEKLRIINNGLTVEADSSVRSYKSKMGNLIVRGNGIHRWDILIEKLYDTIYIGICGVDNKFDKPKDKGFQGWALGSDGYMYNQKDWQRNFPKLKEGDIVNIFVNMNHNQCYFGVNNDIHYENFGGSFPTEIRPFVTLYRDCAVTSL